MLTVNYVPKNSVTETSLSFSSSHVVLHSQIVRHHKRHCASHEFVDIAAANIAKNKDLKNILIKKNILQ